MHRYVRGVHRWIDRGILGCTPWELPNRLAECLDEYEDQLSIRQRNKEEEADVKRRRHSLEARLARGRGK